MAIALKQKTIASMVTPPGEGGIGKIIVSGPDALHVVNTMFRGKGIANLCDAMSHKLYYGYMYDGGQRIDEVILNVIKKGDSFSGEDVVEVNCHGGIRVVMRIYECLQSSGAEGAAWDSLLLQSLENDKIDFIQKEALQEIVRARTKLGVKVLLDQYAGALSGALYKGLEIIEGIRQSFTREAFSGKNDVPVSALTDLIGILLKTAPLGMALTMPRVLVMMGKPNVGKSTIMNAILGEDRVLVHHEPGTTRDYVSEFISVDGIPFELIDTAGMRDTRDVLECMSIDMTREQLLRADKVCVVFDNTRPFDQEDEEIVKELSSTTLTAKNSGNAQHETRVIIPLVNKCDLPAKLDRRRIESVLRQTACYISALNKAGFEDLNRRLVQEFDTVYKPMRPVVFNKRQQRLLATACALVKKERDCLNGENKTGRMLQLAGGLESIFTACLKGFSH